MSSEENDGKKQDNSGEDGIEHEKSILRKNYIWLPISNEVLNDMGVKEALVVAHKPSRD